MNNSKKLISLKYRWISSAFISAVVTSAVLLCIFKLQHLAPFGNNSMAGMDAKIQYLDFFAYLKDVLDGNASIDYTFSKTLGGSSIALLSYYLSSPFSLLVKFFDKTDLNTFFDIVIIMKLSLCAATCSVFLSVRFKDLRRVFVVLLSISYAMMQYNIAQSSNIMWLDGVYMLPIILLGVYYVVHNKSGLLLSISVGLAILFNWYSAGINCLFSILWCGVELLYDFDFKKKDLKKAGKIITRYCAFVMLGIGVSAVLFLPTIFSLREGKGSFDWGVLRELFFGNAVTLVQNFTFGATSSKGSVSLFCGSLVVIGAISYFVSPTKEKKNKRINGILVFITILLFHFMPFCFVFSLLKAVGSYWYRYSYVGVFVLVYLAAAFYSQWEPGTVQTKTLLKSGFGFVGIFLVLDLVNRAWKANLTYETAICYLIVMALLLCISNDKMRKIRQLITGILCIVTLMDLGYNAHILIKIYDTGNIDEYDKYVADETILIESLKKYDDDFYRVNKTLTRNLRANDLTANYNEPLAFGYNSITGYTSAPENIQLQFLNRMGYQQHGGGKNIVNTSIIPADALLGVKYVLANEAINGLELIENLPEKNQKQVYKNPYSLPNSFVYNPIGMAAQNKNPFLYQNGLYSELLGKKIKIFKEAVFEQKDREKRRDYQIMLPEGNVALYGNIVCSTEINGEIYIDGVLRTAYSQPLAPSVFYIPQDNSNNKMVTVSIYTEEDLDTIIAPQFYYLDLDKFAEVVEDISKNSADSIVISPGVISGTVNAEEGDFLYLNVPWHQQWNVRCNGEQVTPVLFGDCLMSIPLQEGENQIEMKYRVRGLAEGLFITLFSMGILVLIVVYNRPKKKQQK